MDLAPAPGSRGHGRPSWWCDLLPLRLGDRVRVARANGRGFSRFLDLIDDRGCRYGHLVGNYRDRDDFSRVRRPTGSSIGELGMLRLDGKSRTNPGHGEDRYGLHLAAHRQLAEHGVKKTVATRRVVSERRPGNA